MRPSIFRIITLMTVVLAISSCSLPFLDHKGYTALDFALPIPQELRSRLLSEAYHELPESYRARVRILGTPAGTIEASAEFTYADDTVSLTIPDIPAGTWNLEVALLDTVSVSGTPLILYASRRTLNIVTGETTLALSLEREAAPVTLVLMDGMTPLESVTVTSSVGHTWISGADGRVSIPSLPTGVYQLAFSNPVLASTTLVLADKTAKTVEVGIKPTYRVTYHVNGGSGEIPVDPASYPSGASFLALGHSLTNGGLVFQSWNSQSDGLGTNYFPGYPYVITGDLDLYAVWIADDHANSYPSATGLALPSVGTPGVIQFVNDVDWFTFEVLSTATVQIDSIGGSVDITGTLYGPDGVSQLAFDDDSAALNQFKILMTDLAPGTYYLKVAGYGTNIGAYVVNLTSL